MSAVRVLLCALTVLTAAPAAAHRLDEYLQATTIAIAKQSVEAEIRLAPGIAVFPKVFAEIDRNADGIVSDAEQQAYAQRVLDDLSFAVDGAPLRLRLVSYEFAPKDVLREGLGEIRVRVAADVAGGTAKHRLTFENRHQPGIGVYLVNALVPIDRDVRITAQQRNDDQTSFQLDYADTSPAAAGALSLAAWSNVWNWTDVLLMVLTVGLVLSAWCMTVRARRARRSAAQNQARLGALPLGDQP